MNPLPNFRSLKSLAKHLAKNPQDNFVYKGMWFTQDYYDTQGKLITYGNKSYKLTINCETKNRYESRKDMNCTLEEMFYDLPITYIN